MYYKVLLVDDEEIVCNGLTRFIQWQQFGFEVACAVNSVAQALVYMENHPVDLVISDIMMPIQNGLQLLEVIHDEYPDVHTIILSGYGEFEYAQRAMRLGAIDFLTKPVNFGELKQLLLNLYQKLEAERSFVREKQEYMQLRMNNLLNSFAKGYLNEYPDTRLKDLGILSTDNGYYIFRLLLKHSLISYEQFTMLKEEIMQLIGQLAPDYGMVYPFNNELDEIACLFLPQSGMHDIQAFMKSISSQLNLSQLNTVIGISKQHIELAHFQTAYVEAGKALMYTIICSKEKIMMYRYIDHTLFADSTLDEQLGMELLQMLETPEQRIKISEYIALKLDEMTRLKGKQIHDLYSFCIQVMIMLGSHVKHCSYNSEELDAALYQSIHTVVHSLTIPSIKESIHNYLTQLCHELSQIEADAHSGNMIDHVKHYINEHYTENITLNSLSNVFFVHPIYLSRLFKEKSGINFIDYITELRITRSKELLKNPALKVYDISQMVGYDSPRYFSKLFKNMTGMTPRDYRESTMVL